MPVPTLSQTYSQLSLLCTYFALYIIPNTFPYVTHVNMTVPFHNTLNKGEQVFTRFGKYTIIFLIECFLRSTEYCPILTVKLAWCARNTHSFMFQRFVTHDVVYCTRMRIHSTTIIKTDTNHLYFSAN